ncbi:DUF1501 domain-containing protein [Phycicoccus sp. CSK15P-2]|uniref:DUF1501 domain-containing protein n=1 Tax=Phycicoccus sp. CSK15P-2 TaxID=2807627 RepID=UPI00194EEEC4|nr:DUF1501 domain-containing protein [Phycicoccus sp. CSK15P-2]MBM6403789.1 DUF1501 domain-containing protein [Phycicoccus sp. CSK15P-2]
MTDLSPAPAEPVLGPDPTHQGCGCSEYDAAARQLSRRGVLGGATALGAAAATVSAVAGAPDAAATTRLTFADAGYTGDTLVVLSLRGGFDGLSAVVPVTEDAYYSARPNIAVPKNATLQLDSRFGLHPALSPLHSLYRAGKLAVVHAVGQPNPTRSHFTDMDEMERAAPGSSLRSGWLDRMVGATTTPGPFAGSAIGKTTAPRSFLGDTPELALGDVDSFSLAATWNDTELARWRTALAALYEGAPPVYSVPARSTLDALETTSSLKTAGYAPANGASYPKGDLGDALRETARLVKAGVGLRAVTVDSGNWDMHADLGRSDSGWMKDQLTTVGKALAAFMTDLGSAADKVTVVTLSEFGRRLAENGSGGLDHGNGNVSFVLGGGVRGGTVYGAWPGLSEGALVAGDLAATTDYRSVLGEILEKRCGLTASTVLPGLPSARLGLVKAR